jgi:hypothetical protein
VQFYQNDDVLLDGLSALCQGSLDAGESVLTIMTTSHRSGLEQRLNAHRTDVNELTKNGRLVVLDADRELSHFMDADGLSRERFLVRFGNLLRTAEAASLSNNRRVVVFGEMVAALWGQEKYNATIWVEQLWNELALTNPFYLCCAYPASPFREDLKVGLYETICAQHSNIVTTF